MKSLQLVLQESIVKGHISKKEKDLPYEYKDINVNIFDNYYPWYNDLNVAYDNWNKNTSSQSKKEIISIVNRFIDDLKNNKNYIKLIIFHSFEDYVDEDSGDVYTCVNFKIVDNNGEEYNLAIDYDHDKHYWLSKAYSNIDFKKFIKMIKK